MTKKELAETLKYSSPRVLYIITWNNLLKKLFCPFKVVVIQSVGELYFGEEVFVEEVKVDMELRTVYIIRGKAYHYFNFEIII
ncbi:MAG: hypothetical protein ACJAYP_000972 [Flavobacterium sp.]|jgi:hypothetical protein